MKERVERVLDRLRPAVRQDGGDVQLVRVVQGIVTLRLSGSTDTVATLRQGIEQAIRTEVPGVQGVETVGP